MEKYEKVKKLGSGSFGSAILVKRRADRQLFVVKEVNLARMNPREREEARNECKVLQLLQHPNVVRYEEHFERRNVLYIVMEYADGGDLHQKVVNQKNNLMREDTVLHYFVQMCLALDYLHGRHILHRDIKAMNVFLTSNGTVKLGDFGISTILRNTMGMANTVCGTPYYFSPELCKNKPYNNKTDVWALGVVLYEMLALRHPFDASNLNQLMQRILKNPTPNIPSIYSREVRDIVNRCLEKDHRQRPSVRALLQTEPVRRALLRLQGDLGAATTSNQRLQQIVAERVSNEFPSKQMADQAAAAAAAAEEERKKKEREQQQQQAKALQQQKLQQQQNNLYPPRRSPSPQARVQNQNQQQQQQQYNMVNKQQPHIAVHDPRKQQQIVPNPVSAQLQNNQPNLPPPPPQQYGRPFGNNQQPKGLAERMAEMERQRAARIKQLEQERKEAEEREKREIDEARKAAAARVAANRARRAEEKAEFEKRQQEEREAYKKRHQRQQQRQGSNPSSRDSKSSTPPVTGRRNSGQAQPISGRAGAAAAGKPVPDQQQHQQQNQQNQNQQQDPRPAVSNAYLAHLRDMQNNRNNQQPNTGNNNNRQAAGDWVEREQQRKINQQQQNQHDIFGNVRRQPSPQPSARQNQQQQPAGVGVGGQNNVEKWLQDEQRKKWNNNNQQQPESSRQSQQQQQNYGYQFGQNNNRNQGAGVAAALGGGGNQNQNQQQRQLPPMLNQNNFQQQQNNNNNVRGPRPMTPPPSPSQNLKPKRKFGAVEPLPMNPNENQQQQNRRQSQEVVGVAKRLPLAESPQPQNLNNMADFAKKHEQAKKGQNYNNNNNNNNFNLDPRAFGANNNNNGRDRSAPPVLSPVRQAPITEHIWGNRNNNNNGANRGAALFGENQEESEGNMELAGDAEMLEVIPSKSGDYDGADSDEELEAHEQLIVQGQVHNRVADERRFKEYNAMGHHIQTLLAGGGGGNNGNNNSNENEFEELNALDEDENCDGDDDDEDDSYPSSQQQQRGNNNNKQTPPTSSPTTPTSASAAVGGGGKAGGTSTTFPLLHLCGGVAFSRWWQSVGNTQEEATALRAALVRRLKREEVVGQVIQLLNMACTSVNGTDGSLAVNMWKMVEPFVNQVRRVVKQHVVKSRVLDNSNASEDVIDSFVDEVVQTASRIVFFEGYCGGGGAKKNNNNNNIAGNNNNGGAVRRR